MDNEKIKKSLETSKQILESLTEKDFSKENLEKIFLERAKELKDRGELLWPLRASLSGQKFSPPPFDILEILGKGKSSERINAAIEKIS